MTPLKFRLFYICLPIIALFSGKAIAQCNNLALADSVNACAGASVSVSASVTDTSAIQHIIWYPGTGVSDTNSLNPTITIGSTSTMYHIAVASLSSTELVTNGDFSAGNTGFSSGYSYTTGSTSPGSYGVGVNPHTYNTGFPTMGDHTTGSGKMMVVDGAASGGGATSIWCESITVTPNTYYTFSAWAALLVSPSPSLIFSINGSAIGSALTLSTPAVWVNFTYVWYSGSATTANICVRDASVIYGGNDFAMDDFSFKGNCVDTDSVYVNVINPIPVHLGNDTSVCAGNRVTFQSSDVYTAPSYLWSNGSTTPAITTGTPGNYWLRVTQSGCTGYDTVRLATRPYPVINLGIDTAFCTGTSYTINPTPGAGETYLWNTGATSGSLIVSSPGTYWVTADSNGCKSSDTIRIIEKPVPVVSLGPDTSLCSGPSVTLGSSVAYTAPSYSWVTGATTPTISPTTSGSYWLKVTERGCVGRDTINVTFRRHPVAALGMDTAFCFGGSYTLTLPAGDDSYSWSTGAITNSITATSTGTYWVSVDSIGCNSTDTINITEVPAFGVHLGPDTTVCTITSILLQSSDTYSSTASYLWNTGSTTASIIAIGSGTYWLEVDQLGCLERDSINITIKYDTLKISNNDTAICMGKSVQVVASVTAIGGIYTYQWIPTAGMPVSNTLTPLITPDTSATYVLVARTPGCPPLMDSFHIDVQPNPVVYIGGNRFLCQFDTLHIDASVQPAWYSHYKYSWTPGGNLDDSVTKTVVFSGSTNTKIYVKVATPNNCIGIDSALIVVTPGNFATITPGAQLCPGDSASVVVTGGVAYHWYPWLYTNDSTASSNTIHPVSTISYNVVVTESHGCKDTVSTTLTVNPAAVISIDDSIRLYAGETAQLSPLTNCNTFRWFPTAGLSSTVISNPVATPDVSTRYFVVGTTSDGCYAIDSIDVLISDESVIAMPNAFTPGNGVNGKFKVILRGEATLNYFRVFNRWGNVVFETKNISEGWDGTFSGTPQPVDVYVYDVQATTSTGKLVSTHGNVTLLR